MVVVNAFYNSEAVKKIKDLINSLPLWTGLMRPYFNNDMEITSSVESIFAEYKTRVFKGSLPMRVDKFVISHLNYLDGKLRLDFAENISSATSEQENKISPKQEQISIRTSDFSNSANNSNSTSVSENSRDMHDLYKNSSNGNNENSHDIATTVIFDSSDSSSNDATFSVKIAKW